MTTSRWDKWDKTQHQFAILNGLPSGSPHSKDHKPSNAQMIEARRAHEAAARDPLRFTFGDPLPGRSALDKHKKDSR